MKNFKKVLSYGICMLLTCILWVGCSYKHECHESMAVPEIMEIPERPFIIIKVISVEQKLAVYAYEYKLLDKNGNVFYLTESSGYRDQPKRMLGDTIK